jgi:hypothetical protein
MSLENIVTTQSGESINGGFTGMVKFAKQRQGKFGVYETAVIVVEGTDVSAMSDAPILVANDNRIVTFSGKGMKRKDDYNGKPQISLGKYATATSEGQATPVESHSRNTQAYPTPSVKAAAVTDKSLNGAELAKLWASLAVATRDAFVDAGLPEIADNAALRAPEWGSSWWFGQRSVETPESEEELPY